VYAASITSQTAEIARDPVIDDVRGVNAVML
jgi:hypothetical protein